MKQDRVSPDSPIGRLAGVLRLMVPKLWGRAADALTPELWEQ